MVEKDQSIATPFFNLLGIIGASIPAHIIITPAINVGGKKVKEGVPYSSALSESLSRPAGIQLQDTLNIMKRRIYASMLPATISKYVSQEMEWPVAAMLPFNAFFETAIGSKLEPKEKFSSVNSSRYPLIYPPKSGQLVSNPADILNIDRKTFFELLPNNPKTKNYGEADWQDLANRQQIFSQNYAYRSIALLCRNLSFCAASVGAGPIASNFVNQNKDLIEKIGLNTQQADLAATIACRMFFAFLTTPFDSLTTKLSAGDMNAKEVFAETIKNIKSRNISSFFAGAVARTILATTTSTTVAIGPTLGKHIKNLAENLAETIENNSFYQLLTSPHTTSESTLIKASKEAETFTKSIGTLFAPITADQISKISEEYESKDIDPNVLKNIQDDLVKFAQKILSEEKLPSKNIEKPISDRLHTSQDTGRNH